MNNDRLVDLIHHVDLALINANAMTDGTNYSVVTELLVAVQYLNVVVSALVDDNKRTDQAIRTLFDRQP